jgi:hypothetical protein
MFQRATGKVIAVTDPTQSEQFQIRIQTLYNIDPDDLLSKIRNLKNWCEIIRRFQCHRPTQTELIPIQLLIKNGGLIRTFFLF